MKRGVVLSHASTMVGPLVTECDDPVAFKATVEAAQPGCVATPVFDDGSGWRTADGSAPEQVIERFSIADVFEHNGFDHCEGCFTAHRARGGF